MSKSRVRYPAILAACVLMVAWVINLPIGMAVDGTEEVLLGDFGTRVQVRGFLGKRLGESMTVLGVWESNDAEFESKPNGVAKPDVLKFKITNIDGKELEKPIRYFEDLVRHHGSRKDRPQPREGAVWKLRCYEQMAMRGIPPQAYKEMKMSVSQPARRTYESEVWYYELSQMEGKPR